MPLPAGEQLTKVVCITTNPSLHDVYWKNDGVDYTPEAVGEQGWMIDTDAVLARDAGDVLIAAETDPVTYSKWVQAYRLGGAPLFAPVSKDPAGVPDATGQVTVSGGPALADGQVAVLVAVDGGAGQVLAASFSKDDTAAAIATAIGALVFTGVTLSVATNVVTFTPTALSAITSLQTAVQYGVGDTGVQTFDMDQDSLPDTIVSQSGAVTVSEDADSINIDDDGDLVADRIIPK